jgi:hypothetical protein
MKANHTKLVENNKKYLRNARIPYVLFDFKVPRKDLVARSAIGKTNQTNVDVPYLQQRHQRS